MEKHMKSVAILAAGLFAASVAVAQTAPAKPAATPAKAAAVDCKDVKNKDNAACKPAAPAKK